MAIQELTSLSFNASTDARILQPYIEPSSKDDFQLRIQHRDKLKANLHNMKCTKIPNFEEQFRPVFERNQLEDKKRQLQLKLSDEGMALYPEYLNMVALLKQFKYIDNDERGLY
jgi:ABC-type phosphate transport system auxiliary subunit